MFGNYLWSISGIIFTYFKPLLYDKFDNSYLSYRSLTPVLEEARQSIRVLVSHSRSLYEVMACLSRSDRPVLWIAEK